ncbi:VanZ family protein [Evansella sp. AB-P1]|uniref:VanZ family protein n=1 Tax=Evansella sp. AB-P1 TaxID=3037653 RepID=UPI00241E8F43|nr:VanZ family protein [Evansella sp. AB-P1]MDG5789367.1 VanZ family protein [Evansella sp. AB-P1]
MYKLLSWIAVFAWMGLIFYLSHQPAEESSELSSGVAEVIITTVETVAPNVELNIRDFHSIVRKNAHFFIYLGLGILVLNAIRSSGIKGKRSVGLALIICVLYAISDEVHQLFVPGRSGEVMDVVIDGLGSSVGIGIFLILEKLITRKRNLSKGRKVIRQVS